MSLTQLPSMSSYLAMSLTQLRELVWFRDIEAAAAADNARQRAAKRARLEVLTKREFFYRWFGGAENDTPMAMASAIAPRARRVPTPSTQDVGDLKLNVLHKKAVKRAFFERWFGVVYPYGESSVVKYQP